MEGLRRSASAEVFEATWGGWDETRHARHFSESMKRGDISVIEVDGEWVGMVQLAAGRGTHARGMRRSPPRGEPCCGAH